MESLKLGIVTVGLKSKTHVVLAAHKRAADMFSEHHEKIFRVDSHIGVSMAGLAADGRVLFKYLRRECQNHIYAYGSPHPVSRLIVKLSEKAQENTQIAGRRPFGVGLLVAGVDKSGPHLFQTSPSANYTEYIATTIGARSQSAKTYLEEHFMEFEDCSVEELVKHGVTALAGTVKTKLKPEEVSISIIGLDRPFHALSAADLAPILGDIYVGREEKSEEEDSEAWLQSEEDD
ncbi:putative multi-domain containing protein [Aduncisulcus paluster]|uniref:Multi-domain containing protein n=1 Tax=Aduncisulcus paluster TaxID=2918883 RepID=A0ABQ5K8M9_9EUKA|nr:putative multi-domain containing protein [Aduncisulcus paluster]